MMSDSSLYPSCIVKTQIQILNRLHFLHNYTVYSTIAVLLIIVRKMYLYGTLVQAFCMRLHLNLPSNMSYIIFCLSNKLILYHQEGYVQQLLVTLLMHLNYVIFNVGDVSQASSTIRDTHWSCSLFQTHLLISHAVQVVCIPVGIRNTVLQCHDFLFFFT